jgi:hypothetical protein
MRLQSPSSEHNVTPFSRGTQHAGRVDTQLYTLPSSVYLPGKDRGIIPLVELHICRTTQALHHNNQDDDNLHLEESSHPYLSHHHLYPHSQHLIGAKEKIGAVM